MSPSLPRGLWAVASDLSVHDAEAWMQSAAGAAAWTFRRPAGGDREALSCLQLLREGAAWLAVHGRSDLALLGQADALIAGAQSLPWDCLAVRLRDRSSALSSASDARAMELGAAVHDAQEVDSARKAQASFLVLGPIWQTPRKRGILEPQGCDRLRSLAAQDLPVLAIGGVDRPERVQQAHASGAHGVLVLRAAQDPQLFAELVCAWRESEAKA
jgi:thiamine monophosphate synthase